jgi:hypothetical protein
MKPLVAYISHPAERPIGSLRGILQSEGLTTRDSFDFSAPEELEGTTEAAIRAADVVIAVIGPEAPNVLYELGFASALRKPTLLLLEPGTSVPALASNDTHLVSDLTDSEVLRLGVKKFLDEARSGFSSRRTRKSLRPIEQPDRDSIAEVLEQADRVRRSADPAQVEWFASRLLNATAVTAVEEYRGEKDRGVDFAVWSNALQTSLGNPILIEIKAGILNKQLLETAYSRLTAQVLQSRARVGLLLYLDQEGRRFRRPEAWRPDVFAFDLEDFGKELLAKPFAKVLLELRNKHVHRLSE